MSLDFAIKKNMTQPTALNTENDAKDSDDDDYVQFYFQQQFKEKIEPIRKNLLERTEQVNTLLKDVGSNKSEIKRVDLHYDEVCKAILKTTGCQIKDLGAHEIFK